MVKHETSELLCDDHFCIADVTATPLVNRTMNFAWLHFVAWRDLILYFWLLRPSRVAAQMRTTGTQLSHPLVQKQEYGSLDL